MGFRKFRTVLGRDHPAAIIQRSLNDRISWIKIILRFYVDDQADRLSGSRNGCQKTDIISDRSFLYRTVLVLRSPDLFTALISIFIRIDSCLCNLRDSLYISFRYLLDTMGLILFHTAFHDPR